MTRDLFSAVEYLQGDDDNFNICSPRLYWDAELLSSVGGGFVLGVGGWESCCVAALSPGPLGHSVTHVAPLMVALNYFTQLEVRLFIRFIKKCVYSKMKIR